MAVRTWPLAVSVLVALVATGLVWSRRRSVAAALEGGAAEPIAAD